MPCGCSFLAACHAFCAPQSSSWQLLCLFSYCLPCLQAKTKNPTAAVLGSPANSLGSPLSSFLLPAHGSTMKTKKPPKPQHKRHVSFRLLRHLPGHGLGRTRRRLALRSLRYGCNPFVPHSLHPSPHRTLKAVFHAKNHINSRLLMKKRDKEKHSHSQKPKKAQQR